MNRPTRTALAFSILALIAAPAMATICVVPDNGSGTADMPPNAGVVPTCTTGYVSPSDFHMIIAGLPAGSTIEVGAEHTRFLNPSVVPDPAGGGNQETFESTLQLQLTGTGDLAGFARTLQVPIQCTTTTGPRTPGAPVQTFDTEMVNLHGEIFGDPDFDLLRITAGTGQGLPSSPGQTTLTDVGGGQFNVDSFFDITYRIEFTGAPGSQLAGMGGTTDDTVQMRAGDPVAPTPASGRLGLLIAAIALALMIPIFLRMRRPSVA